MVPNGMGAFLPDMPSLYSGGSYRCEPGFGVSKILGRIGLEVLVAAASAGAEAERGAAVAEEAIETGCFVAGTWVHMEGGAWKPVEWVAQGDKVIARDPVTGKTETKTVTRTFKRTSHELVTAQFTDAQTGAVVETITGTPEHPFFTTQGVVALGSLGVGTQVVTRAGPALVVKSVVGHTHLEGISVYNLEVEGDHTYFVGTANGGLWVHNGPPCLSEAKKLMRQWDKGTFDSRADSLRHHFDIHGHQVGAKDVWQYMRKAAEFNKKGLKPRILEEGKKGYAREGRNIIYDYAGKILTYGKAR